MLKRGVFVIVLVLLISIVYAQTTLKGDFNNDGKIDFDDFFLFADAFKKCNEEKTCNVKFDLDFDYDIDVEDFFIFADGFGKKVQKFSVGENCKEVFPGFNGPVNERVNLVFLSFNYENIDKFLEKVKPLVNPDDKNSFFSFEPVKSNKNKFNLWYVDKAEQTTYKPTYVNPSPSGWEDFNEKWKKTAKECNIPGNVKVIINMMNSGFRASVFEGYSSEESKISGLTGSAIISNDNSEAVLFHEFMHAFGKHLDEYILVEVGWHKGYSVANNCDVADASLACFKWCKGPSISLDKLKQYSCSNLNINKCIDAIDKGNSCFFIGGGDGRVGKANSCINIVSFCTSLKDKASCIDTKNNFFLDPVCKWIWTEEEHSYYKSKCIPGSGAYNIGTQCIGGTMCYAGCGMAGLFRSERQGMLMSAGFPLGAYNEKILCDRIKAEIGNVGGRCNELFELFK